MDNHKLDNPIAAYFRAVNAHDDSLLLGYFAEDAVVFDEGHEYQGIAAIKEWNNATCNKYNHKLEVTSVAEKEGKTVVTALVTGNFEGSPAYLDFCFIIEDEKVSSLSCG
ncbi:MAG: hypothetical protein K0S01_1098 [Herbinix sp.]|jgi:ketosteroid isomerase-like protein|nr:hypothetical protein [Herbinix sp.]